MDGDDSLRRQAHQLTLDSFQCSTIDRPPPQIASTHRAGQTPHAYPVTLPFLRMRLRIRNLRHFIPKKRETQREEQGKKQHVNVHVPPAADSLTVGRRNGRFSANLLTCFFTSFLPQNTTLLISFK